MKRNEEQRRQRLNDLMAKLKHIQSEINIKKGVLISVQKDVTLRAEEIESLEKQVKEIEDAMQEER